MKRLMTVDYQNSNKLLQPTWSEIALFHSDIFRRSPE